MDPRNRPGGHFGRAPGEERHQGKRKSRTIAARRLKNVDLSDGIEIDEELERELQEMRPKRRSDCQGGPRPCPWVSCKYHLYLDINPRTGSIKLNFPDVKPWEMTDSCVLDIADRGPVTLEDVGRIMNLTRERIRQLEASASERIRSTRLAVEYRTYSLEKRDS
ncbi:MAG: DNA-binding protein [Deltaproteobacteria bacterium]|nr:DNA-binding protein [Deltaproteobacteria bacterium]